MKAMADIYKNQMIYLTSQTQYYIYETCPEMDSKNPGTMWEKTFFSFEVISS